MRADAGIALLALVLAMWFAPNLATMIDVVLRRELRRAFGGGLRFGASVLLTIVFVTLLAPIMWASHTVFLFRLLSGRTIGWGAQTRDDHAVPWSLALRQFWPQTLIGLAPVLCWRRPPVGAAVGTVHRAGSAALDPAGGCDGVACARPRARSRSGSTGCPRRPRRRPNCARSNCPRSNWRQRSLSPLAGRG